MGVILLSACRAGGWAACAARLPEKPHPASKARRAQKKLCPSLNLINPYLELLTLTPILAGGLCKVCPQIPPAAKEALSNEPSYLGAAPKNSIQDGDRHRTNRLPDNKADCLPNKASFFCSALLLPVVWQVLPLRFTRHMPATLHINPFLFF